MCARGRRSGHQTARDAGEQASEGVGILERALVGSARVAEIDSNEHRSMRHFDERVSHRFVAMEMNDDVVAAVVGVSARERHDHLPHRETSPMRVRSKSVFRHPARVVPTCSKSGCQYRWLAPWLAA